MEVVTILTIVALNILLPTADVFTDINLAVKLYTGPPPGCKYQYYYYRSDSDSDSDDHRLGKIYKECREDPVTFCSKNENQEHCEFYDPHPMMATVLLMPFLLNYIVCFYTFFRLTTNRKKYLFIFPLLNLYPQYEAAKLIYSIYKDPVKGKKEKKEFDQNIGLHEVFLESVPTALIITVIFVKASRGGRGDFSLKKIILGKGTFIEDYSQWITGGYIEFLVTFSLSVFSASLGLAKCLKNGVARPIGDGGCLDGLLSCRHLLAFFACGLCLVARGVCLGFLSFNEDGGTPSDLLLSILLLFVPQCLLAIFSTLNLSSKNSLKIITHHPSLLLLPTFTFFTFSKVKVFSCGNESRVKFSKKFTWVNMAVSEVGYVCWAVWIYSPIYFLSTILPLLLGSAILLTIIFLHLDRLSCCCSCTGVPGEEISVYDPATDKRFVIKDGELVEPPEYDVETGDIPSSSFGGRCSKDQDPHTEDEDVAIQVNYDEQEVRHETEDTDDGSNENDEDLRTVIIVIDDLLRDIVSEKQDIHHDLSTVIVEYVIEKLLCDIVK